MNREYKVGDWVKIKEEYKKFNWYHEKPMKVIDIVESGIQYQDLLVDYEFPSENSVIVSYHIELYPMRENKLKRILDEQV